MELMSYAPISKERLVNMLTFSQRNISISNRVYGYTHRTTLLEYKTLLTLYFFEPNSYGLTDIFSIKELSNYINATYQGTKKALNALISKDIIKLNKLCHNKYNVSILGYKSQFLTNNGGYLHIRKNTFMELMKINDINTFRIILSQVITNDNNRLSNYKYGSTDIALRHINGKNDSLLVKTMPMYQKPHMIIGTLKKISNKYSFFKTFINNDGLTYKLQFSKEHDGYLNRKREHQKLSKDIDIYIDLLNAEVNKVACEYYYHDSSYESKFNLDVTKIINNFIKFRNKPLIKIDSKCIKELAYLAVSTSGKLVKDAINILANKLIEKLALDENDYDFNIASKIKQILEEQNINYINSDISCLSSN